VIGMAQALTGFGVLLVAACSVWGDPNLRVELSLTHAIRFEIFARGSVNGVSPQANQFHHKSASGLSRIQHAQTDFTSQSFGSYSTRQPPMQGDEKRKGALSAPSWRAAWAWGGSWRHENGASAPVFTCQAKTSDILTGG
jgi:hypothetical protein